MFVLISVGWNTVTQVTWHKCVSLTVLSPSLQRYTDINIPNWQNLSFLLIYFLSMCFHQVLLESYSILYKCQVRKNSPTNMILDASVRFLSDCLLVDCLYICWNFVVDCLFWSGGHKAYGCYPFQKVVRHIFIHVNIIFYIWIVGLFNELQYNAMYFYIVSSFLFKDRDYFISC